MRLGSPLKTRRVLSCVDHIRARPLLQMYWFSGSLSVVKLCFRSNITFPQDLYWHSRCRNPVIFVYGKLMNRKTQCVASGTQCFKFIEHHVWVFASRYCNRIQLLVELEGQIDTIGLISLLLIPSTQDKPLHVCTSWCRF
jgi:hypothetical protein